MGRNGRCKNGSMDLWDSIGSVCYLWDHFLLLTQTRNKTNLGKSVLYSQIFNMATFCRTAWTMISSKLTKETHTLKAGQICIKSLSLYLCLKVGPVFILLGNMLNYQWS